jgi:transcriptional regulator with XRE-family HTH domain
MNDMGLERINELRKQKRLNISELAARSGVPFGTISKICSGKTKDPQLETLKAIARVLDISIGEFDDVPMPSGKAVKPDAIDPIQFMMDYYSLSDSDKRMVYDLAHRLRADTEHALTRSEIALITEIALLEKRN